MKRMFLLFVLLANVTLLSAQSETVKYKYAYSIPTDDQYQMNADDKYVASNHVNKQLELTLNIPYKTAFVANDNIKDDMTPVNGCYWFSYLLNNRSCSVKPVYEEYFLDENLTWIGGLAKDSNNKIIVHIFQKI